MIHWTRRVLLRYNSGMKTAISLPDDLFASADALAKRLGLSRSGLIAAAVAEFIAKHRASKVTEQLNAVYATENSELDPFMEEAARRMLRRQEW